MDKQEYLKTYGIEPTEVVNAIHPTTATADSVDKMRERLELKKLEIEIKALEKPDTSIDYYSKMLELQEKNFAKQLEMQAQHGNLKLEIEKLKLADVGDSDDWMEMIKPLLPVIVPIIKSKLQTPQSLPIDLKSKKAVEGETSPAVHTEQVIKGDENMDSTKQTTAGELQEYVNAIKNGEISYEEALEDFRNSPYKNVLTDEQFKEKFDKIKKNPSEVVRASTST